MRDRVGRVGNYLKKCWLIVTFKIKYRKYHPASNGYGMIYFTNWVRDYTDISTKKFTIFEIGANYGQDADAIRHYLGLQKNNVWLFEAHPQICEGLSKLHKGMHIHNSAVSNVEGDVVFNICDLDKNSGVSSLLVNDNFQTRPITVKAIRMDNFMKENNIHNIDFLKIDVEGFTYEVIEGFGARINDVKLIHLEAEHKQLWNGEKLWMDIKILLESLGFEVVYFQRNYDQSDSLWIRNDLIKHE